MVQKMMAKEPDDRYQSAREILRDLVKVRDGIAVGLVHTNGTASQSQPVALSLSGTSTHTLPLTNGPAPHPTRVTRWVIGGLAGLAALATGVLVYAGMNPPREPAPQPAPVAPTTGLPDVRPLEKLVTTRERELLALLDKRGADSLDVINHSIGAGPACTAQRRGSTRQGSRFAKAQRKKVRDEAYLTRTATPSPAGSGEAIVIASRLQMPRSCQTSCSYCLVRAPSKPPPGRTNSNVAIRSLLRSLLNHLDLGQAVSDTLNRNALALGRRGWNRTRSGDANAAQGRQAGVDSSTSRRPADVVRK